MYPKLIKFALLLAVSLILISGCAAPSTTQPEPFQPTEPAAPQTVHNGADARAEEIDLIMMESFPVQMSTIVRGSMPDGCCILDEIKVEREGNNFVLQFISHREGDFCTEAEVSFEKNVFLDVYGLSAGTYRVVTDTVTAEWTFEVDNMPDLE